MKRPIIKIDEDKCNGCGLCIPNCPEGALQIIDGKAKLVKELMCDGLGACLGHCPEGAIMVEEREAEEYDEKKVMENIIENSPGSIKDHLEHLKEHNQIVYLNQAIAVLKEKGLDVPLEEPKAEKSKNMPPMGGCPGSRMMDFSKKRETSAGIQGPVSSELSQWPIQLHLINPQAPYFQGADLVVAADCAAFAYGNFHQKFLKDEKVVIFCPKLDAGMDVYEEKLIEIFKTANLNSITLVHMEVPCCYGLVSLVERALKKSGKNILLKDYTVSIQGELI